MELLGRYQSREYTKVTDTDSGASEKRTAYEVSVRHIRKAGGGRECGVKPLSERTADAWHRN